MDSMDAMDNLEEKTVEAKTEARDRALGLFACPRCGTRITDAERATCDFADCQKPGCIHCQVHDEEGGNYCDTECRIGCYRDLIRTTREYAEQIEREYTAKIAALEATG